MDFTIKRDKWLRGNGVGQLLDAVGRRCVTGFVASQLGVGDVELMALGTPNSIPTKAGRERLKGVLVDGSRWRRNSVLAFQAAKLNDDQTLKDPDREARLQALFLEHGHTLKFE